jgi:hypothetical protein
MKPAQPDPAEILPRVRQQLILAQVRIMELEDARDATAARLDDVEKLFQAAQALADQKLDEASHAEKTRAGLQIQFENLQRDALATTHALESARAQQVEISQKLDTHLRDAALQQQRLAQLDVELRRLKSSRTWRWTAWLRALGGNRQ